MSGVVFLTPASLPPTNGYSHAVTIDPGHRLIWTSGQVALTAAGTVIGAGDWELQTRAVMTNVGSA